MCLYLIQNNISGNINFVIDKIMNATKKLEGEEYETKIKKIHIANFSNCLDYWCNANEMGSSVSKSRR